MIHIAEKTWVNENDLNDFNYSFVFAAAIQKITFDYTVFNTTFSFQKTEFDDSRA